MHRPHHVAMVAISFALLTGCGGGGGGGGATPPVRGSGTSVSGGSAPSSGGSTAAAAIPTIFASGITYLPAFSSGTMSATQQPALVASTSTPVESDAVALSPDGSSLYEGQYATTPPGCFSQCSSTAASIAVLDPVTLATRRTIPLPNPESVDQLTFSSNGTLYAATDSFLYRISGSTITQVRPTVTDPNIVRGGGIGGFALSKDGTRLYVDIYTLDNYEAGQTQYDGAVVELDATTFRVLASQTFTSGTFRPGAGGLPHADIALANNDTAVFAGTDFGLVALDADSLRVRGTIDINGVGLDAVRTVIDVPGAAGCDGDGIYVGTGHDSSIFIVDSGKLSVTKTFSSGVTAPISFALTSDGKLVAGGQDKIAVFASAYDPTSPSTVAVPLPVNEITAR